MTATAESISNPVGVNNDLATAMLDAVNNGLMMCDLSARCVALSRVPSSDVGVVTGLIGVHGKVSGFITVNMSERFALRAVGGLLGEKFDELNSQVVDGAGEMTNIICGGIKSSLAKTVWAFQQITVPSVIVGTGYQIAYARGLEFGSVTFELDDPDAIVLQDRLMNVSISLLKL
ncbi:MAG: chemotaxis protein CheX [Planctomycetales bacterium]|nr:chemotaxis protein CheX [Planctomycetales bacterium]